LDFPFLYHGFVVSTTLWKYELLSFKNDEETKHAAELAIGGFAVPEDGSALDNSIVLYCSLTVHLKKKT
jgi:hypothetical protein